MRHRHTFAVVVLSCVACTSASPGDGDEGSTDAGAVTSSTSAAETSAMTHDGADSTGSDDGADSTEGTDASTGGDTEGDPSGGCGVGFSVDSDDPGSLVGDLWTPGRDDEGVVTLASYQTVPSGRWIEVDGTRLDQLDAVVKAAIAGWYDPGSGDWVGYTDAWCSPAFHTPTARAWWVSSGGHADSANNGIYRFDGYEMAWAVEHLPSDTNLWSTEYTQLQTYGSFTNDPESARQATPQTPVNGISYDEIWPDLGLVPGVGTPTARHTYSGVQYYDGGNGPELIMAVRRLWRFSLTDDRWTLKRLPGDTAGTGALGEESILHISDEGIARMYSAGSGGPWGTAYDLEDDGGSPWLGTAPPGTGWEMNGAADTRVADDVVYFRPGEPAASDPNASPGRYLVYNVQTGASVIGQTDVQYADGISREDFLAAYDGAGMVYVPLLDRYWVTTKRSASAGGGFGWYELDPGTTPWTLRPLEFANPPPVISNAAAGTVRRRMAWIEDWQAVIWMASGDQNVKIFKPSSSACTAR